jgi:beta-barrel assembly-enhancing protease
MLNRMIAAALLAVALTGCATNPVTGRSELRLVSEAQEVQIGREHYAPLRQAEGGDLTVDPGLTRYVNEVGQRIAAVSDRPDLPYEFVVVNNSVPNAWALPGGKIGINRGLLTEMDSEAELAAVLAHEIVHAAARHSAQRIERGMMMELGVAAIAVGTQDSRNAGLIGGVASISAALLTQRYSRSAELEADRYGMLYMHRAGYDPRAAVALQATFVRLSEGRRSGWLDGLFASHPPSQERVESNRVYAAELGHEGMDTGRDRYHQALAYLERSADAYAALDEGRKALAEGRAAEARTLAMQAITLEPREAHFHGLLADARRADGPRAALPHYDAAIRTNADYFAFHLGRGLTHRALGNRERAIRDLQRSNELLPTAAANTALGEMAETVGQRGTAIAHYRAAAYASGSDGQRARQRLAQLELGSNARSVIQITPRLGDDGRLVLAVANHGALPARDVTVRLTWLAGRAVVQQRELTLRGTVPAGGRSVLAATDVAVDGATELDMIRVLVLHADPAL